MGLPAAALTARLGETFRELAGRAPAGWWAAPGRVNVIGDHTDYNEGFALPMAIDRHVLVAGASRGDGEVRVRSLQQGYAAFRVGGLAPGSVRGWAAYLAGVVWALRDTGHDVGGADLALDSTVPAGSGLSSSAALECAACLALCDLYGLGLTTAEIARLAQRAENDYVGMPCGVMDQLAATHGRAGNVLLLDAREVAVRPEPFDLPGAGLALAVIDTRAERRLIEGGYAERRSACEAAARMLGVRALRDVAVEGLAAATERLAPTLARRARHVVTENARVLEAVRMLRAGRIADAGPLLTASHRSLRDDYAVSCRELDTAVDAALSAGACGARMTGAGFGGCAIALVEDGSEEAVTAAVAEAFTRAGFREPGIFPAVPSNGARRLG